MKRKWFVNLTLLLISTLLGLFLAEMALRYMLFSSGKLFESLREPSAYAIYLKDKNEDFFNDDYWKLLDIFRNKVVIKHPQSLVGWAGYFDTETLDHFDQKNINGRRPVLLYGDSFAYCSDIDSIRCYEDYLNSDPDFTANHYFLNYGVGGYGVDQICLLFKETVDKFDNPFVIFSFLTSDIDRSMLTFRDGQKPYFQINNGELELKGVPITLSSKEYIRQNPPEIRSYLLNRFRNSILNPIKNRPEKSSAYIEEIKSLNELILARVFKRLNDSGIDYVILIFHPENRDLTDWRIIFLLDLCEKYNVPYICDMNIRNADSTFASYDPYRYAIKNDGHPTSYMNELVAREFKRYIMDTGYRDIVAERNYSWRKPEIVKDIEYYTNAIRHDSDWLEQVRLKAERNGIPLDSMIYLDAKYMVEKDMVSR